MNRHDSARRKLDLVRIAGFSTALGLAFVAGSLQAFRMDESGLRFRISFITVIVSAVGALIGWAYWRTVRDMIESETKPVTERRPKVRRFALFSVALVAAAVGSYIYRLRFVPSANVREVAEGLLLAFIAVGFVAFLLWWVVRFLERMDQ